MQRALLFIAALGLGGCRYGLGTEGTVYCQEQLFAEPGYSRFVPPKECGRVLLTLCAAGGGAAPTSDGIEQSAAGGAGGQVDILIADPSALKFVIGGHPSCGAGFGGAGGFGQLGVGGNGGCTGGGGGVLGGAGGTYRIPGTGGGSFVLDTEALFFHEAGFGPTPSQACADLNASHGGPASTGRSEIEAGDGAILVRYGDF